MVFEIASVEGSLPEQTLGPRGRELEHFIPKGVTWRQLNYGQGEGQVEIDGCEWGFYFADELGTVRVALHEGNVDAAAALAFVRGVAEKLYGRDRGFSVRVVGTGDLD